MVQYAIRELQMPEQRTGWSVQELDEFEDEPIIFGFFDDEDDAARAVDYMNGISDEFGGVPAEAVPVDEFTHDPERPIPVHLVAISGRVVVGSHATIGVDDTPQMIDLGRVVIYTGDREFVETITKVSTWITEIPEL
jgi:hypothetical protein